MAGTPSLLTSGNGLVGNLQNTNGGFGVFAKQGTVAFGDTSAKTLFTLPAGAIVVDVFVDGTTAFNDSGTDLLDVGKTGTGNFFIYALDIAATGRKAPTKTNLGVSVGASAITVTATYTGQNANASTGAATITFLYAMP